MISLLDNRKVRKYKIWLDLTKYEVRVQNILDEMKYRKVASSRLSRMVAHPRIFRLLMKGKFDGYVPWPLTKRIQNWIVDRSSFDYRNIYVLRTAFCLSLIKSAHFDSLLNNCLKLINISTWLPNKCVHKYFRFILVYCLEILQHIRCRVA